MEGEPIKIFIAEDSPTACGILKKALAVAPDFQIVGVAQDGQSAVEGVLRLQPDVALIDLGLPKLDGAEVTKQLKCRMNKLRVMIITGHDAKADILQAFAAGADGYYLKTDKTDLLIPAVRAIHAGAGWLHPAIASTVLRSCAHTAEKLTAVADQDSSQGSRSQSGSGQPAKIAHKRDRQFATATDAQSPVNILVMLGWSLERKSEDIQAEAVYHGALALAEKLLGPKDIDVASLATKLADFYYDRDKFMRAEPLYHKALEIRHSCLGQDHLEVAASLEDLAILYDTQSDYGQAEHFYLWSLQIREKLDRTELTAETCSKLSWLFRAQGKLDLAQAMEDRGKQLRQKLAAT